MQTDATKTIVQDWSQTGFEGPEKLLEVWFAKTPTDLPAGCAEGGLKAVTRTVWEEMLDLVHCKVLSVINAPDIDAYLLSESSMFIFPHKLILKTCGTTTLLAGLRKLLDIAVQHAGFPAEARPWRVFYSRKNYMFPDAQKAPHKTWQDEMDYLDRYFEQGSAYQIGPMNGDHWYLYMYTQPRQRRVAGAGTGGDSGTASMEDSIASLASLDVTDADDAAAAADDNDDDQFEDETVEVLMTELSPARCRQFYKETYSPETVTGHSDGPMQNEGAVVDPEKSEGHLLGIASAKKSGLERLCCEILPAITTSASSSSATPPTTGTTITATDKTASGAPAAQVEATMDSFLFDPLGYSANVVRGVHYCTIHVTPEDECSYASFESNFPAAHARLPEVLDVFQPGKVTVTRFATQRGDVAPGRRGHDQYASSKRLPGYKRDDRIHYELDGYILEFENWVRR